MFGILPESPMQMQDNYLGSNIRVVDKEDYNGGQGRS